MYKATVIVIGHLGKDAEVKEFSGEKYMSFSVASTKKVKDSKGVESDETTWVSCLRKGETGVLKYLTKGTKVFVEGSLVPKVFEKNGKAEIALNCRVNHIELLSPKDTSTSDTQHQQAPLKGEAPLTINPFDLAAQNDETGLPF